MAEVKTGSARRSSPESTPSHDNHRSSSRGRGGSGKKKRHTSESHDSQECHDSRSEHEHDDCGSDSGYGQGYDGYREGCYGDYDDYRYGGRRGCNNNPLCSREDLTGGCCMISGGVAAVLIFVLLLG